MNQPGADIVQRLRWTAIHGTQADAIVVMEAAAKAIEELRTLIRRLEAEVKTLERIIRDDKRQGY